MVSTSGSSDHNQRHCLGRQHWRAVFWPLMLITSVGMASILFLISCARVSELELTAYRLERQIDEQQAARSRLWQTVSRLYDRSELRRFVNNEGMILVTNGTTKVTLPPLPPEQWVISPSFSCTAPTNAVESDGIYLVSRLAGADDSTRRRR